MKHTNNNAPVQVEQTITFHAVSVYTGCSNPETKGNIERSYGHYPSRYLAKKALADVRGGMESVPKVLKVIEIN